MAEMYPHIKHAHWLFILLSVLLFNIRFWLKMMKPEQPFHLAWRILPPINDTFLLFSGMMLMTIAKWSPFGAAPWLGVKLLLVVVYIVLGIFSIRSPARSPKAFGFYAASMVCIGVIAWLGHCKLNNACQFFANWV